MREIMKKVCIAFFFIMLIPLLKGKETSWSNYTNTNKILDILINGDYLWIATDGGLYKYNKNTEEYDFYNRANASLPDNHLRSLALDSSKKLWLTTHYYGIGCFDDVPFSICSNWYRNIIG